MNTPIDNFPEVTSIESKIDNHRNMAIKSRIFESISLGSSIFVGAIALKLVSDENIVPALMAGTVSGFNLVGSRISAGNANFHENVAASLQAQNII
jgi:hypothetical protein